MLNFINLIRNYNVDSFQPVILLEETFLKNISALLQEQMSETTQSSICSLTELEDSQEEDEAVLPGEADVPPSQVLPVFPGEFQSSFVRFHT